MDILFYLISLPLLLYFIYKGKNNFGNIIVLGLLLRLFIMAADLQHLFPIIHSGKDTEAFHMIAMRNATLGQVESSLTNYTSFLTIIYTFFYDNHPRMVAQFINVLFGIGVILIVRRCMNMLNTPRRVKKRVIMVLSFMPTMIIMSSILLREAWVEFFIALSALFFLRWALQKGNVMLNMCLSIASVFAASYMHPGVIGMAVGYLIAFILYKPSQHKIKASFSSVFVIAFAVGVALSFIANLNVLGDKFAIIEEVNEDFVEEQLSEFKSEGGSAYLQWLNVSSMAVGFAALPLRMFYFLFSPIPLDWRGAGDIIAFVSDSIIYLLLLWYALRTKIRDRQIHNTQRFLLIGLFITTMIFALGTTTAGTAMRHRAKYFSIIALTYAMSQAEKYRKPQQSYHKQNMSSI